MSEIVFGRLEKLNDLRNYWRREDTDFTPWLADEENITILGDTIGIDLEVQEQEVDVGPFRADILCRNTIDDTLVLVENQLERTDHIHLGQLLTYAAGLDAVTLIWVVETFTEEHRAALDWLNRITNEKVRFFGIEIELWRIDNSEPAPRFNVVAKPNDWAKIVKERAYTSHKALTPWQQMQKEFWTEFGDYLVVQRSPFKPPKPAAGHWVGYGIGRADTAMIVAFSKKALWIDVQIVNNKHPTLFQSLQNEQSEIEEELGFQLLWDEQLDKKHSRIRVVVDLDIDERKNWPDAMSWIAEHMTKIKKVFRPRLKAFNTVTLA